MLPTLEKVESMKRQSAKGRLMLLERPKPLKTFIRVIELWLPTADRSALEFGGGLYGPLSDFKAVSQATRFWYDEGLPGKAWAQRHPIVLKDLENSYFKRGAQAAAVGLTCGIALPIFAGPTLKAVLVFFCGSDDEHVGAIETWSTQRGSPGFMGLIDGYYGTAELFEWKSRSTQFSRGLGLPGQVWKSEMPLIMTKLFRPGQFLRWEQAQEVGVTTGLGVPYSYDPNRPWVVTFLSALGTPIARRFEIWVPGLAPDTFILQSDSCDATANLAETYANAVVTKGGGLIGRVLQTGLPQIVENVSGEPAMMKASLERAGVTSAVAMPILDEAGGSKAVVAWYF
jgi:hypothetical protein